MLLIEKYGTNGKEIIYGASRYDSNKVHVVVQKLGSVSTLKSLLCLIFLPQGYPDSVSDDYIKYQFWDTAQAFCSTITGTLATQEVLKGVGVGDKEATPLAATVTWILKDGCGNFGRILFAWSHGTYLDAYSKKWRLYADTLNDAAMCLEMSLPLFKHHTTAILCITSAMKAIVGVAGGATRSALTQHHAVRGNLADVSAKDSAQETAVNLVASLVALLILTVVGNSLVLFSVLVLFHITSNYMAVRSICLRTMNEPRFVQTIDKYLSQGTIATPYEINLQEPIFQLMGTSTLDSKLCGFRIVMGQSLRRGINSITVSEMADIKTIYRDRNYLLIPNLEQRTMHISFRNNVQTDEILRSYFHGVLLSIIICHMNNYIHPASQGDRPLAEICRQLEQYQSSHSFMKDSSRLRNLSLTTYPSRDVMERLDAIADKEWILISAKMKEAGWDLRRHLFIIDEWRIDQMQKDKDL